MSILGGTGPEGSWQTLGIEGLSRRKATIVVFSRPDLTERSVNRG